MPRRSAGFITKRPHKKSRGGCFTCKKKRVKCDEEQPLCGYCKLRRLTCTYQTDQQREQSTQTPDAVQEDSWDMVGPSEFNEPWGTPKWITPAIHTSSGYLTPTDLKCLHHYREVVWSMMSLQKNDQVTFINRDWVPRMSISTEHMLYSILSISAAHLQDTSPHSSEKDKTLVLKYRQRALTSYNKALNNITSENYESLLMTSIWMMILVAPPTLPCSDDTCLAWASALFTMMQGLRVLASLRWASGIEELTIYPLLRRELRKLPPRPMLTPLPDWSFYTGGKLDDEEWRHPNSPRDPFPNTTPPLTTGSTGRTPSSPATPQNAGIQTETSKLDLRPERLMTAAVSPHAPPAGKNKKHAGKLPAPAFLPPPLMALLHRLVDPLQQGPLDLHRPVLIPALHALSPIFLSLYYYRLSVDIYVRIFVLPTVLRREFLALVRAHEPRALVLVGWYFALLSLLPQANKWFPPEIVRRVLQSVSNVVMRTGDGVLLGAMEGAFRVVRTEVLGGKEAAARTVFEGWEGVIWEEGPRREEQWRREREGKVEEE